MAKHYPHVTFPLFFQRALDNHLGIDAIDPIAVQTILELNARRLFQQLKRSSQQYFDRGIVEPLLCAHLAKAGFGEKQQFTNTELFQYRPDILIWTEDEIVVDVEIDEPYVARSGEPIHVGDKDTRRDEFLASHGAMVVRFAEDQVIVAPDYCVSVVNSCIEVIRFAGKGLRSLKLLIEHEKFQFLGWTEQQARQWASQQTRYKLGEFVAAELRKLSQ